MAARTTVVIVDASGTIIAATHEDETDGKVRTSLIPGPGQKMYRIADVPEVIANLRACFKNADFLL